MLRSTGGSLVGSGAQWGDELEGQCAGKVMRTKGDALEGDALDGLCERGSGGFRKTMRSSDWEWVRPLMDLVKHAGSENLLGTEKLLDADAEVEVDEEGWPTIFKTFMASCKDGKEEEDDDEDGEGAEEEGADNMSVGKSAVSMSRNSSCRTLLIDGGGAHKCVREDTVGGALRCTVGSLRRGRRRGRRARGAARAARGAARRGRRATWQRGRAALEEPLAAVGARGLAKRSCAEVGGRLRERREELRHAARHDRQ